MDILEHVLSASLFANRRSEIALRMTILGELGHSFPYPIPPCTRHRVGSRVVKN